MHVSEIGAMINRARPRDVAGGGTDRQRLESSGASRERGNV